MKAKDIIIGPLLALAFSVDSFGQTLPDSEDGQDFSGFAPEVAADIPRLSMSVEEFEHNVRPRPGSWYVVGPNEAYKELDELPWSAIDRSSGTLQLYLMPRPEPYRTSIMVRTSLTLTGLRDAAGHRPVISGADAVSAGNVPYYRATVGLIQIDAPEAEVSISGVRLEGAEEGASLTDSDGDDTEWHRGSACIHSLAHRLLVVHDSEITGCGFGVFTKSYASGFGASSSHTTLTGNYVHDNNRPGYDGIHNAYTQGGALSARYNRFGELNGGSNVKSRDYSVHIEANYFESAPHFLLDIVEAEEHHVSGRAYGPDYVQGNIFENDAPSVPIHYGTDHYEYSRSSRLLFSYNTVRMRHYAPPGWSRGVMNVSTTNEHVFLENNVFWLDGIDGSVHHLDFMAYNEVHRELEQGGTWHLGANLLPSRTIRNDNATNPYVLEVLGLQLGSDGQVGEIASGSWEAQRIFPAVNIGPVYPATWRPRRGARGMAVAGSPIVPQWEYKGGGYVEFPLTQWAKRAAHTSLGAVE